MRSVTDIFDQVGYSKASPQARRTMWGVVLAKSGTGVIGVWSVVNIYYFSFFKLVRDDISVLAYIISLLIKNTLHFIIKELLLFNMPFK